VFYRLSCQLKRLKWSGKARKTLLAPLYQTGLPRQSQRVLDTRFLVIDCEMTGLNPARDQLLSIGWVEIEGNRLLLETAQHYLIYSQAPVGKSASIHGLQDHQLAGAKTAAKALTALVRQAQGKVLVFHHAGLDLAFLHKATMQVMGCPLLLPYIDTMMIEKRRLALQNRTDSLQLNLCRDRYGLPPALAHTALADARATAELFLAQCAQINAGNNLKLGDLAISCI